MKKEWLSTKEASNLLKVSQRHVITMIHDGRLKARRDGKLWLVHSSLSPPEEEEERISEESYRNLRESAESLKRTVEILHQQIESKDKQIEELHQLLMASHRNYQNLLEDTRPFWRRWFGRKRSE